MNLTPEEKEVGRDNYYEALGVSRRDFLKGIIATGAVSGAGLGAMYFGYGGKDDIGNPVRVGVIGTGDEGSVLIGAINPDYVQVKAIADIRPSSIHRAFYGDWASPAALAARPGLMKIYGWETEDEARRHVKVVSDYNEILKDKEIEAVIIALPLHLHHPVAMAAMAAGKHVLTEKLMAHDIAQCKEMGRTARDSNLLLATGHQRHYSILYDNAVNLLRWGILGELQFIRAQWHRGNLPGMDSWSQPLPGGEKVGGKTFDKIGDKLAALRKKQAEFEKRAKEGKPIDPDEFEKIRKQVAQWAAWDTDKSVEAVRYGYREIEFTDGRKAPALEELIRWRLWNRTGGGLMVELGSHQLDAAAIFVSALRGDDQEVHPLTVHAVGGRHTFPYDRDADDHVYCTFEFPGPGYDPAYTKEELAQWGKDADKKKREANLKRFGYYDPVLDYPGADGIPSFEKDPGKKIVVTYSTTMGNGFGGYGETVMGTKGTLILDREKEAMLFAGSSTSSRVAVKSGSSGPTMDTQASGEAGPVAKAAETGPVSRGYREEIEHWAWCIRQCKPGQPPPVQVKCYPPVAIADAVIALTTKEAMKRANNPKCPTGGFVRFKKEWFDMDKPDTPEEDLKV